jgi:putative acetyltransferase
VTDGVVVRAERPGDVPAIRQVNDLAFGQPGEGLLVDALREAGQLTVSLVAEPAGEIVGHIAFSPVTIEGHPDASGLAGLGPMAVRPDLQRRGIGSRLVREGLAASSAAGFRAVVLLGHPEYYPRFGFVPASRFSLRCVYDAPDEAFMALELVPGALASLAGTVHYAPAFDLV